MKIRFYGKLGEKLGEQVEFELTAGTETISDLRAALAKLYPEASGDLCSRTMACVEDAIVNDVFRVSDVDIVEFFPPLSGG